MAVGNVVIDDWMPKPVEHDVGTMVLRLLDALHEFRSCTASTLKMHNDD